jgi:hypothetical protein
MRACRYLGVNFCEVTGIPYGPLVERWAWAAETAELEADAYWANKRYGG